MAGFDPNKSRVSADQLAEFLASPVVEDITTVPGIGPAAKETLAAEKEGDQPVRTTHQLLGKFLTLKDEGITQKQHCDAMWFWLQGRGVNSFRAGIVHSLAEKLNIMIPGLYTPEEEAASS